MKLWRAVVLAVLLATVSILTLQIVGSSRAVPRNVTRGRSAIEWTQLQEVPDQEVDEEDKTELNEMEATEITLSETELDFTKSQQTRKPFNPDVDLTILRDVSFDKVG